MKQLYVNCSAKEKKGDTLWTPPLLSVTADSKRCIISLRRAHQLKATTANRNSNLSLLELTHSRTKRLSLYSGISSAPQFSSTLINFFVHYIFFYIYLLDLTFLLAPVPPGLPSPLFSHSDFLLHNETVFQCSMTQLKYCWFRNHWYMRTFTLLFWLPHVTKWYSGNLFGHSIYSGL